MPAQITRVQWSASDIPFGMSFDERTGTFSGTPEDAGEYIVPVKVKTNYGEDEKNVVIRLRRMYSVSAIGYSAKSWSNNAEPDEYGFYPLNIPKSSELRQNLYGFRAMTADDFSYYRGVDGVLSYQAGTGMSFTSTTGFQGKSVSSSYDFHCGKVSVKNQNAHEDFCYILIHRINPTTSLHKVILEGSGGSFTGNNGSKQYINSKIISSYSVYNSDSSIQFPSNAYTNVINNRVSFLADDGAKLVRVQFSLSSPSSASLKHNVYVDELSCRAVKVFDSPLYSYLSEDGYLDNNPDNFPYGRIKNAWFVWKMGYVLTENNQLYEYDDEQKDWKYLGNWEIKKIEIPSLFKSNTVTAFMLTENGELYYKGPELSEITSAHETFEHIYPECVFIDITTNTGASLANPTLIVMKE